MRKGSASDRDHSCGFKRKGVKSAMRSAVAFVVALAMVSTEALPMAAMTSSVVLAEEAQLSDETELSVETESGDEAAELSDGSEGAANVDETTSESSTENGLSVAEASDGGVVLTDDESETLAVDNEAQGEMAVTEAAESNAQETEDDTDSAETEAAMNETGDAADEEESAQQEMLLTSQSGTEESDTEDDESGTEETGEETEEMPVFTETFESEVTVQSDGNWMDNDTMWNGYVSSLWDVSDSEIATIRTDGRDYLLSDKEKVFYDFLKPLIESVAAGERSSTVFTYSFAGFTYTAEELGITSIVVDDAISSDVYPALKNLLTLESSDNLIDALLEDCPYDLYWYNKGEEGGCNVSLSLSYTAKYSAELDAYYLVLSETSGVLYSMSVSSDYGTGNEYEVDNTDLSIVQGAVNNAKAIVSKYASYSDYNKLKAYLDEIDSLASYNTAAADKSNNTAYGDPWQLVWVFDEDDSTTVVCEGYSKAFKYLCDLSTFNDGELFCLTVSGTMSGGTGEGNHMWNIVHTESGNYLVDATNCDTGTVGYQYNLFMVYDQKSQSDYESYTFSLSKDITFKYDSDTLTYGSTYLKLATKAYSASKETMSPTITAYTGTYDGTAHDAVTVSGLPTDVSESNISITYSTDDGTNWSSTMPTITDVGTKDVMVKIEDATNAYYTYTSAVVTAEVTAKSIADSTISVSGIDSSYYYTGSAITPEPIVKDGSVTLTKGTDYTLSYSNNTAVSDSAIVTITGTGNYTGTTTVTFAIKYLEKEKVTVLYNSTTETSYYNSAVAISADGFTVSDSIDGTYASSYSLSGSDGTVSKTLYFKQDGTGYISEAITVDVVIDTTAPAGSITLAAKSWEEFVLPVTFGAYKASPSTVTITADDAVEGVDVVSGVKSIEYAIVTGGTSYASVSALEAANLTWSTYDDGSKPNITDDTKTVVYAKLTDNAGNVTYISSDGVILDTTAPLLSDAGISNIEDTSASLSFTAGESGTYYYKVVEASASAPTSAEIIANPTGSGTVETNESGSGTVTVTLTSLTGNTSYVVYIVMQDDVMDISTSAEGTEAHNTSGISSVSFTTEESEVTLTEKPTLTGTYGDTVSAMTLTGGTVTYGTTTIAGTWVVTDSNKSDIPEVGTTAAYEVTFTPDDSQYASVTTTVVPTVSKKTIEVKIQDVTITYGDAIPESFTLDYNTSELVTGDTETALGITTYTNATDESNAGKYTIGGTLSSKNYNVVLTAGILTIEKAAGSLTVNSASITKTYGDASFSLSDYYTATGDGVVSYNVTTSGSSDGSAVISVDADGTVTVNGAGSATVTVSMAAGTNYTAATDVTISVTVAKKAITVTADDVSRAYGVANPEFTFAITGGELVGSDTISDLGVTLTTMATADSDVGTYPITGTATSANYDVTVVSGTLTITQQTGDLTVPYTTYTKTYGDASFSLGCTTSGDGTISYESSDPSVATVGENGTVTIVGAGSAMITVSLSAGENYSASESQTVSVTVNQKAITVTVGDVTRAYGEENPTLTYAITSGELVSGDEKADLAVTLSTTATADSDVGTYEITGSSESENYAVTVINGTLTVTKAAGSLTTTAASITKTYGDESFSLKDFYSAVGDGVVSYSVTTSGSSDDSAVISVDADGMVTVNGAGSATITISLAAGTNYTAAADQTIRVTVNKKAITVTVSDASRMTGVANPTFTYTITEGELVSGDTTEDLGVILTTTADEASTAGSYDIVGTASSNNYDVTIKNGTLTVYDAGTLTVPYGTYTVVYGDEDFSLNCTTSNSSTAIAYTSDDPSVATVSEDGIVTIVGAGNATIMVTLLAGDGTELENYPVVITVNRADAEITIQTDSTGSAQTEIATTYGSTIDLNDYLTATSGGTLTVSTIDSDTLTAGDVVVTVNADGTLSVTGVGTAVVTVYAAATDNYNATEEVTLTIQASKASAGISGDTEHKYTYGQTSEFYLEMTHTGDGTLSYEVTEGADVVSVDENGLVTILGTGTAVIQVTLSETDHYLGAETEVTITIVAAQTTPDSGSPCKPVKPAETEKQTESETEKQTEAQTESESEKQTEAQTESETEKQTESETEGTPGTDRKEGLVLDEDEVFRYYVDGIFAENYVGVVPYDGGLFFIRNGLIDFGANELCLYEGIWYYVSLGQVQLQYSGLAMHDGEWFYITKGLLDTTKNGLVPYDNATFLVAAGRLLLNYNGLWQNASSIGGDGLWYFIAAGKVQAYTGIAQYDGAFFVVTDGIFDSGYHGTVEYDGATFTVVNGQLYG